MQCFNPHASPGHTSSNSFSVLPWHSDPPGGGSFARDLADSPESNLQQRAADRQKLLLGYEQGIGDSSEPAAFSLMLALGPIKALAPASHLGGDPSRRRRVMPSDSAPNQRTKLNQCHTV